MTERIDGCVFCRDLDTILWRGEGLFALPDFAPLTTGHALICTVDHYPSAADLPKTLSQELDEVTERLRELYLNRFGAFTMFEHGRTGHCLRLNPAERICHHTHIHLLPLRGDLVLASGLTQRTAWRCWSDVAAYGCDTEGYAIIETTTSGRQFFPISHELMPHYLRSRAAELLGMPNNADWEQRVGLLANTELLKESRTILTELLGSLPARHPVSRRAR
ncbi:hypothetical protein ABZ260_08630 [Streptosporangium sp. NPDC006013]|uniref:HIT family protein n=1 Tax=Streptosporangium sp. NPDC006013 TaxID=3155596 RepID=UPI0033A27AE4